MKHQVCIIVRVDTRRPAFGAPIASKIVLSRRHCATCLLLVLWNERLLARLFARVRPGLQANYLHLRGRGVCVFVFTTVGISLGRSCNRI